MVTPESIGGKTGRLYHHNPKEVEEIIFKCNFMTMIETFKGKGKKSSKKMEEKTNKIFKKTYKSLKETQENQEKAIKVVKKAVQDLKNRMNLMKKTQTGRRLDM